eukprot:7326669-Pyramimonas_sp.AAC.1
MDATVPSPRGRPLVARADDFVARPPRTSQSVSRRNKICCKHPLSSVKPAAGQTATTGDEMNANMALDFTAVCGSPPSRCLTGRSISSSPMG